jgi:gluconolactonase
VLIANQFSFTEGPVWDSAQQALLFTDIDGDKLYRFTEPNAFEVLLASSGIANGLAIDSRGRLLVAGFGARNVWRMNETTVEVLVDSYRGLKLNSPDDLVARGDGTIYFTDPTYGIDGTNGPAGQEELGFMGVFRLTPDGTLSLEDASRDDPNGASLSPDEHTLFVSFTSTGEVTAFDVAADGSLGGKRTFAAGLAIPDGMTVDRGGNVYVAVFNGIAVVAPDGTLLGTIAVPQWASNCAFGGVDQKTLFITARNAVGANKEGALYRIDDMPIAGVAGQP